MIGLPLSSVDPSHLADHIQRANAIDDPHVVPHVARILAASGSSSHCSDITHLSNVVKQTHLSPPTQKLPSHQVPLPAPSRSPAQQWRHRVESFAGQNEKLRWAGAGLSREQTQMADAHLAMIAQENEVSEIRFWGRVFGSEADYYVIQGRKEQAGLVDEAAKGDEKQGEGINESTFWVSNSLVKASWSELPAITRSQLTASRRIKLFFSGSLLRPVFSHPPFDGQEAHYLKAQLVRMTNSLEVVPKGLYKPNDDNPKLIELEEQPKVPDFADMSSLENWQHRNPNVLQLGRCSHWVDSSLPEEQLEAAAAELAEKDPEIERLRAISEDKLPEGSSLGVENVWQVRQAGDSQVFQQGEASCVYGVVCLRNVSWPGWLTIGYKDGFSSFYNGYGLKEVQGAWESHQNVDLQQEEQPGEEHSEPNPKELPLPDEAAPEGPQPE